MELSGSPLHLSLSLSLSFSSSRSLARRPGLLMRANLRLALMTYPRPLRESAPG